MISIKKRAAILFFFIFAIQLASSEILVSQPKEFYSVGEEFNISFILRPNNYVSGFFVSKLVCGDTAIEIYRATYTLDYGLEKEIFITTNLANFIVGEMKGECKIEANYGKEKVYSRTFQLSRNIETSLQIEGRGIFSPEDIVKVYGTASKNNKPLEKGFVEVQIPSLNLKELGVVQNGRFNLSLKLPYTSPAGNHNINSKVYEKDKFGEITNHGTAADVIKIRQICRGISLAINSDNLYPGESLEFKPLVYDQSKNNMNNMNVDIKIYNPKNELYFQDSVYSNQLYKFGIVSNHSPGNWRIEAKVENLSSVKLFYIQEFEKLSFKLENNTLIVKNVGNVAYKKVIEVSIGNSKERLNIQLEVEETKRYKLNAPDGNYEIEINDGALASSLGSTFLTGNAISIEEFGKVANEKIIVLIIFILILFFGLLVIYLYRRFFSKISRKKNYLHREINSLKNTIKPYKSSSISKVKEIPVSKVAFYQSPKISEEGVRQESSIVALKIKNANELNHASEAIASIDKALMKAKKEGAKIYTEGDFRILIFAPITTQEIDNAMKSIKVAQMIQNSIEEYNNRFAKKISYGIGINYGELIIEINAGKFKFTSLKNAIGIAKGMANASRSEIFCSETIKTKTTGKIKVHKVQGSNFWKIEKISDNSKYEEFIKKFQEKQNIMDDKNKFQTY